MDKSLNFQSQPIHQSAPEVKPLNSLVILPPPPSVIPAQPGYDFYFKVCLGLWPALLNCFVRLTPVSLDFA